MTAEIYHLYHSGVVVKTNNSFMVFDYYNNRPNGKERKIENGVLSPEDFSNKKENYVFVSHNHADHFNQVIFDWKEETNNIKYIMSSDLKQTIRNSVYEKIVAQFNKLDVSDKSDTYFVAPDERVKMNDLTIETYDSTDKGVSFLVKTGQLNIFHAGDLNWWHWKDNTEREQKLEEKNYKKEINKLSDERVDIAFVPVDPRLEEYYHLAGEYFIKEVKPEILVPIHFSDNFDITERFAVRVEDYSTEVVKINNRGQKFIYDG